jgi:hypothetical protein
MAYAKMLFDLGFLLVTRTSSQTNLMQDFVNIVPIGHRTSSQVNIFVAGLCVSIVPIGHRSM